MTWRVWRHEAPPIGDVMEEFCDVITDDVIGWSDDGAKIADVYPSQIT